MQTGKINKIKIWTIFKARPNWKKGFFLAMLALNQISDSQLSANENGKCKYGFKPKLGTLPTMEMQFHPEQTDSSFLISQ